MNELNIHHELEKNDFRVAIFGSARIKKGDKVYKQVHDLAKLIGLRGYDIITGGGPGLMQAANEGHAAGDKQNIAESIGLTIQLPHEQFTNEFVEFRKHFKRFAERLETFALLANVFVVTTGGIGTMLELFYMWQLVQVKDIPFKPIILVGEMWQHLIYWVIDYALHDNLISSQDFNYIYIVKNNEEAIKLIDKFNKQFKKYQACSPIKELKDAELKKEEWKKKSSSKVKKTSPKKPRVSVAKVARK